MPFATTPKNERNAMTYEEVDAALEGFAERISNDVNGDAVWLAMHVLADRLLGAKLFTITTVDMKHQVTRRQYSSHPDSYPVSGTKPIFYDQWFETVCTQRAPFVANTIKDIEAVFPDHDVIWSLGCGSVINVPVVIGGDLVGTVNCLDVEHRYTKYKVALSAHLALPAKLAFALSARPNGDSIG